MAVSLKSSRGLPDLRRQLAGLASPDLRLRMSRNLAEEARTQIANGFRGERDPYGKPWAPLTRRQGMILQDTGRLRGSVATQASAAGFRIDMPVAYAAVHQYGGRVKPHSRKAVVVARGGRARAGRTSARAVKVSFRGASAHGGGGIPQRQMIPMASTGGLGPVWGAAFDETARGLLQRYTQDGGS